MTDKQDQSVSFAHNASRFMGATRITLLRAWLLTATLVIPLFGITLVQHTIHRGIDALSADAIVDTTLNSFKGIDDESTWYQNVFRVNRLLLNAMDIFEDSLEENSWFRKRMEAPIRLIESKWLDYGGGQVIFGDDGWLFFRPDVSYLTGPGFLEVDHQQKRIQSASEWKRPPQPDPLRAIVQFHEQLQQRNIRLFVMPTPVKPMISSEKLIGHDQISQHLLRNPSWEQFYNSLTKAGVMVFDPAPVLMDFKSKGRNDPYLQRDTHWTPEAMSVVAEKLAVMIANHVNLEKLSARYTLEPQTQSAMGDLADLLQLPGVQEMFPVQSTDTLQVIDSGKEPWHSRPDSEILLLGDSFSNIYSHNDMGWGFASGFGEHLSYYLQRPLDTFIRNSDGAFATRMMLTSELAKGRDRLEGKIVVIWQFAARELAQGDWKLFDMSIKKRDEETFFVPDGKAPIIVTATVAAVSGVPKPRRVPYKDYIRAIHLVDLKHTDKVLSGNQAVVYAWAMRENEWTETAYFRPGQQVVLELTDWNQVIDKYDHFNRGELENDALLLAPICWGEVVSK